jgi:uncharacterized FlgJ-related protein
MKSPSTASDAFRQLRISEQPKVFLPDRPECENKDRVAQDKELFIRKTFEDNPEKGVELLFKFYYRPLCSHAARYVYSKELAEDLVGEVFERFWQKQLYAQVSTSFQAYLFTAVRHQAFQYLRASSAKSVPRALKNWTWPPCRPARTSCCSTMNCTSKSKRPSSPCRPPSAGCF